MKKILPLFIILLIVFSFDALGQVTESFDGWSDGSYSTTSTYNHVGVGYWRSFNSMCHSLNARSGNCVRFNDDSMDNEFLIFEGLDGNGKDFGVGTISFWYRHWNGDASNVQFLVQYKIGDGIWIDVGSTVTVPNNTTYYQFSEEVNTPFNNVFVKVKSINDEERLCIDDFTITNHVGTTPSINLNNTVLTDFSYFEGSGPSSEQTFTVEGVNLTNDISLAASANYEISETSGSGYTSPITLTQSGGTVSLTTIYIRLKAGLSAGAYDNETIIASSTGAVSKTLTCYGDVYKSQPSNHVTGFATGTTTSSSIPSSWTENDGDVTPDGYLIKASTGTVSDPVDGTDPADDTDLTDGSGNIKVAHGTSNYTFDNCSALTLYNFKIYPYTNSGTNIDFKITSAPSANATTQTPKLLISEVTDPNDVYQARFVELYNADETTIDFDTETWYLCRQTNGSTWEDKQLTGSIAANETYVLANNNDNTSDHFYLTFDFMADYNYGGSSGNGDDGYFLYFNGDHSTGTLIDAYGVIGETGSGTWEYENAKAVRKNTITGPNSTWTAAEWNKVNTCISDRMTPDSYPETVWNGSTNNDWASESNWDNGLTGSTINVKIWPDASNFPIITSGTNHCNDITIDAGGIFSIHDGTIEIHGNVLLKSDENGFASIVDTNSNGVITYTVDKTKTVQCNLLLDKYHYVSSPISSQNYSLFQVGVDTENDFFNYDEPTNYWIDLFSASGNMEVGRGYAVQIAGTGNIIKEFTGSLNTGNKTYAVTLTSGQGGGVNLIGNPYPSAISALDSDPKSFLNKNSIVSTLYFWDEPASYTQQSNDYATYNATGGTAGGAESAVPNGYISPCQGFFVRVSSAGDILFKNNMRSSHSAHFFKNDKSEVARVWISLTNSENDYNEILIGFPEEATPGVDNQYDGLKFKASQNLAFYSVINNEDYVIQGLPPLEENISVRLGVDVGIQGGHTFKLKDFENFSESTSIILEDKQENKFINLFQQIEYTTNLEPGRIDDRFLLHFTGPFGIDEISQESIMNIYSFNNDIYIQNNTNQKFDVNISIKNILGQEILNKKLTFNNTSKISLDVVQGYYFVKIFTDKLFITKKVYLN